jgi:hypothetical protein
LIASHGWEQTNGFWPRSTTPSGSVFGPEIAHVVPGSQAAHERTGVGVSESIARAGSPARTCLSAAPADPPNAGGGATVTTYRAVLGVAKIVSFAVPPANEGETNSSSPGLVGDSVTSPLIVTGPTAPQVELAAPPTPPGPGEAQHPPRRIPLPALVLGLADSVSAITPGQPPGTAPWLIAEMKVEVPDSETRSGLVAELLSISSDPLADGKRPASPYSTDTLQDAPTARVAPLHVSARPVGGVHVVVYLSFTSVETHALLITNPPADLTILAAEMLSGALPVFATLTVCGSLSIED